MVQPSNLADVAQEFISHLALEPEKKFILEQNDPGGSSCHCLLDVAIIMVILVALSGNHRDC